MKSENIEKLEKSGVTDESLEASFNNSSNEMAEVLKELFDEGKIYMIGDLTKDEIKLATRIYMVAEIKDIKIWKTGLAFFCKLMLSRDRKSRKELLDAIRGYNQQKSFLSKFNPFSHG